MQEACIGGDQTFVADDETSKVPQPGKGSFHDPSPAIAAQLPPILMGRFLVVPPSRDDRFNPPLSQAGAQGVAVIAAIRNQALRSFAGPSRFAGVADRDRVEGLLKEGDFRRGRRLQVCSQRSTRAIDQNHPLRTLATFRFPDFGPPFLAGTKLPSTKHSSQRSFCWSLSWAKNARQSLSKMLLSSQCLSRRQQVLALPYRRGNSLHWHPVTRIHKIPSRQRRSSTRGRPPRGEVLRGGRWTRMASHCCWVSFRHAMGCPPVLLGNTWPYHTPTSRF
jgi:hypothetical protein